MKRIFGFFCIAILVLILVGGIFLFLNFDHLVKTTVEKIATDAAGTQVRLSGMDISLEEKRVDVSGIKVSNLPGYKKSHIVTIGNIHIALESATRELVVFKEINITDTSVALEVGEKATNITDLKNRAASNAGSKKTETASGKSEKAASSDSSSASAPPPKVIIRRLRIGESVLEPSVTLLGGDLSPVNIPEITMTGIGQKENGIPAREAIIQVLTRFSDTATKQASQSGYLQGMDSAVLKDIQGTKDMLDKAKDDFRQLGKDLKGLFGG